MTSDWKLIGGGILDGKEVIIFVNNITHEIDTVPKELGYDITKAL